MTTFGEIRKLLAEQPTTWTLAEGVADDALVPEFVVMTNTLVVLTRVRAASAAPISECILGSSKRTSTTCWGSYRHCGDL